MATQETTVVDPPNPIIEFQIKESRYSIPISDIHKYPYSKLAELLNTEYCQDRIRAQEILPLNWKDRSDYEPIFQHVLDFYKNEEISLPSEEILDDLFIAADFFNLPSLAAKIVNSDVSEFNIGDYVEFKSDKLIKYFTDRHRYLAVCQHKQSISRGVTSNMIRFGKSIPVIDWIGKVVHVNDTCLLVEFHLSAGCGLFLRQFHQILHIPRIYVRKA